MENKKFSLAERLNMQNTQQMEKGEMYTIAKVDKVIEYTDKKTGEVRNSVIVTCADGVSYYLPNVIAKAYLDEIKEKPVEEVNALFEGHTFRCEEFTSRKFGNTGKTLHLLH